MATQAAIEAAKELSAFCKTAPGRLPERITNAMAVVDAFVSQPQPVNERLLAAATVARDRLKFWLSQQECDCEDGHRCGRREREHELKELNDAIAAAEAEIEERRKPVTEEWLKDLPGWEAKQPSLVPAYLHKELYAQVNFWPKTGSILLFGSTQINDPQRWHVLDLMSVMEGAQ